MEDSKDYLFYAKTNEGYVIKILFELLQHCIKTASFNIYPTHLHLCTSGINNKLLIVLSLFKEKFREYKCDEPLVIGLNLNHMYKMIKSVKKKDSIVLYIKDENFLNIEIEPHENTRTVRSRINIQDIHSLDTEVPEGYENDSINISSSDYQKMAKELNDIGKVITIASDTTSLGRWLQFSCDAHGVYDRANFFGSKPKNEIVNPRYKQSFQSSQLTRIIKMSGLCKNIRIFTNDQLPLKIIANVGELGTLELFLKSVEQCKEEKEDSE